jgi:hypothetical protein
MQDFGANALASRGFGALFGFDNQSSIIDVAGNKRLRVTYPAGKYSDTLDGMSANIELSGAWKTVKYSFDFLFENGFSFGQQYV